MRGGRNRRRRRRKRRREQEKEEKGRRRRRRRRRRGEAYNYKQLNTKGEKVRQFIKNQQHNFKHWISDSYPVFKIMLFYFGALPCNLLSFCI